VKTAWQMEKGRIADDAAFSMSYRMTNTSEN
jgi:hypothetical protein